jgi:putative ABC transport system substrate-binding protein
MGLATADAEAAKRLAAFREPLEALGWHEDKNFRIVVRGSSDLEALKSAAADLVSLDPDVILAHATPATAALRAAGATMPIVFVSVSDPIGNGFVASLARPGANITGFTNFEPAIGGKWIELLKELAPGVARVAMLYNRDTASGGDTGGVYLEAAERAACTLGLRLIPFPVQDPGRLDALFGALADEPGGALAVMPNIFTAAHRDPIVSLAAKHRLPAVYPIRYFVSGGGLFSYGVDIVDLFARAAAYVHAILGGVAAASLPVQSPTKFELVINMRTVRALGLTVPPAMAALADDMLE